MLTANFFYVKLKILKTYINIELGLWAFCTILIKPFGKSKKIILLHEYEMYRLLSFLYFFGAVNVCFNHYFDVRNNFIAEEKFWLGNQRKLKTEQIKRNHVYFLTGYPFFIWLDTCSTSARTNREFILLYHYSLHVFLRTNDTFDKNILKFG